MHAEPENAHSHLLSMMLGNSETIPVTSGKLATGTWQASCLSGHHYNCVGDQHAFKLRLCSTACRIVQSVSAAPLLAGVVNL